MAKPHPHLSLQRIAVVSLLLLNLLLILIWGGLKLRPLAQLHRGVTPSATPQSYPELAELRQHSGSFTDLKQYFTALANDKGGAYAYDVLRQAELPPNTDMHLLGHIVGDVLYQQKGVEAIQVCTQDFRNACSHSVVIGLLMENGPSILPKITAACHQAPGGSGAYTMCFHGLGHGVLAYNNYDLAKAVEMCRLTGTEAYHQEEFAQCVGGVIMELVAGSHNLELWQQAVNKYLTGSDPLAPCSTRVIPEGAKIFCYNYLTPHLFRRAGADLGHPTPKDYERAFRFCQAVPRQQEAARNACFAGFGKEFVAIAPARDIRKITDITEDQFRDIATWCGLAKVADGTRACLIGALSSVYWGGENAPAAALRLCSVIDNAKGDQEACYAILAKQAVFYRGKDQPYLDSFCQNYPQQWRDRCISLVQQKGTYDVEK